VRRYVTVLDLRFVKDTKPAKKGDTTKPRPNLFRCKQWIAFTIVAFPCVKFLFLDDLGASVTSTDINCATPNPSRPTSPPELELPEYNEDTQRSTRFGPLGWTPIYEPVLLSATRSPLDYLFITGLKPDCLRNLLYLDISWGKSIKYRGELDGTILTGIGKLENLKILKLRGLNLGNAAVSELCHKLGHRLFSLDIRGNKLTDDILPLLPLVNILAPVPARRPIFQLIPRSLAAMSLDIEAQDPERYEENPPDYTERRHPTEEQEAEISTGRVRRRADDAEGMIQHLVESGQLKSMRGPSGLPSREDPMLKDAGLTHLYISENELTSHGVRSLLEHNTCLQVLDVGSVVHPNGHILPLAAQNPNLRVDGLPFFINMRGPANECLESLRIHHSFVTHVPTLITKGDFRLSESRRVRMAENEYAVQWIPHDPFIPDTNPRIRSLTLTDVPRKSYGLVINWLKGFLDLAARQESNIELSAPADRRRGAEMLSGLRVLRLEFEARRDQPIAAGLSVSGNADADVFMEESAKDFSFFDGDGGEEDDSPDTAPKDFSFFDRVKTTIKAASISSKQTAENETGLLQLQDVAEELLVYRVEMKAKHEGETERLKSLGAPRKYWTGTLELVT
jgi:hypothetical protein